MYNKKVLSKMFCSVVLAIALAFPTVSPVLGSYTVQAQASEKAKNGILKEALVKVNELGFGSYLSIVLEDGVDFNQCKFFVDEIPITPSKVSDTGSVSKWELVHLNHKTLTVEYNGKRASYVFNEDGTAGAFQEEIGKVQPKWIWSGGSISIFDFHSSSYDADGNKLLKPAKTTFDVLNSTEEGRREIAYYVSDAVLDSASNGFNGGPGFQIKFSLLNEEDKAWFDSITKVGRMAEYSQSNTMDDPLTVDRTTKEYKGSTTGIINIRPNQQALRRVGMNYIRITADKGSVVIPVEIVSSKEPKLTLTGAITNVKVGETIRFKVDHAIQGLLTNKEYIKSAVLKRPIKDKSRDKEEVKLEPIKDIYIIDTLLGIDGKVLTKAGWYELELDLVGYKKAKVRFKVLPAAKTTPSVPTENTEDQNNGSNSSSEAGSNSSSGTGSGSSSGAGSSSSSGAGSSSSSGGGGSSGGGSGAGGSFGGGSGTAGTAASVSNVQKSETTIDDETTPLNYASIKEAKVKVVKVSSEKVMKKALLKDVKSVFGEDKNIRLQDLLLYLFKADSKKNQRLANKLTEANLYKRVNRFALRLKLVSKKQLTKEGLNRILTKKEVQKILDGYIRIKLNATTIQGKAVKINALSGATSSKKIHIGGKKSNGTSTDITSANTLTTRGEFLFDYDMLVNALILKELGIGNIYSNKIADMFWLELTSHNAIFTDANHLYKFDHFRAAREEAEYNDVYLDYASFIKTAGYDDKLPGSTYQLTVVLDNGSLGQHYFGGLSANPDEFGAPLPKIDKVSIKLGEDLRIDLKDENFVQRIYKYGGILVNRKVSPATDSYGAQINGTILTMPAREVERAIANSQENENGMKSFYIELDAKGYHNLHIDIEVDTGKEVPAPSQPGGQDGNSGQTGENTPGQDMNHPLKEALELKLLQSKFDNVRGFVLDLGDVKKPEVFSFIRGIQSVYADESALSRRFALPQGSEGLYLDNWFYVYNERYLAMKFSHFLSKKNKISLEIRAANQPTLTLALDLKQKTAELVSLVDKTQPGNNADTGSNQTGDTTLHKLPDFSGVKLESAFLANGYDISLGKGADFTAYKAAIRSVKAAGQALIKVGANDGVPTMGYRLSSDGKIRMILNSAINAQNRFELEIEAENYPTVRFSVDLSKKEVKLPTKPDTNTGSSDNQQGNTDPSKPDNSNPGTTTPNSGETSNVDLSKLLNVSMTQRFGRTDSYDIKLGNQSRELGNYIKAINKVKIGETVFEKHSTLLRDNQYVIHETDGLIGILFKQDLLNQNNLELVIEATGYRTLTLGLDLRNRTVRILSVSENVPAPSDEPTDLKELPVYNRTIEPDNLANVYRNRYKLTLASSFGEGDHYIHAISHAVVNGRRYEKVASISKEKQFSYAGTDGYLSFQFEQDVVNGNEVELILVAPGYKTVKFILNLNQRKLSQPEYLSESPEGIVTDQTPALPSYEPRLEKPMFSSFDHQYRLYLAQNNGSGELYLSNISRITANAREMTKTSYLMSGGQYSVRVTDGYIELVLPQSAVSGQRFVDLVIESAGNETLQFRLDLLNVKIIK